ncbi:MAG: hypothetical protein RL660_2851 [Bacteroidota bacterium]|jgi:histidinol-phosphate phosphatase family protein
MDWLKHIDNSWTLFLDRDGVINEEIDGDYVRSVEQLVVYPYAADAVACLNNYFGKTVIATNQRCVGRGIITEATLHEIHAELLAKMQEAGAKIDAIYFAPDVESDALMRKPNIGMALKAAEEFSDIDFAKSIMVGNNESDIDFGINAGMHTIFVETTKSGSNSKADIVLPDLQAFADLLKSVK